MAMCNSYRKRIDRKKKIFFFPFIYEFEFLKASVLKLGLGLRLERSHSRN